MLRLVFAAGAMVQTVLLPFAEILEKKGRPMVFDTEQRINALVQYCAAGMLAPATGPVEEQ